MDFITIDFETVTSQRHSPCDIGLTFVKGIVGEDGMSNKQEKAVKLIEKGSTLEIISEDDFLKNI